MRLRFGFVVTAMVIVMVSPASPATVIEVDKARRWLHQHDRCTTVIPQSAGRCTGGTWRGLQLQHQFIQHLLGYQIQALLPIFARFEPAFNPAVHQKLLVIVEFTLGIDDTVLIRQNHSVKTQRMHALIGLQPIGFRQLLLDGVSQGLRRIGMRDRQLQIWRRRDRIDKDFRIIHGLAVSPTTTPGRRATELA